MYYVVIGAALGAVLLFSWSAGEQGRQSTKSEQHVQFTLMAFFALVALIFVVGALMQFGRPTACTYEHGAAIGDC